MRTISAFVIFTTIFTIQARATKLEVDGQKVVDQVGLIQMYQNVKPVVVSSTASLISLLFLQLTKLATYTDDPNPFVTRILFTPNDMLGRRYVCHAVAS